MKIGIGIDTGGTYTDAVAYDFGSRAVLAGAKALTTRPDISAGIIAALDSLPRDLVARAELIALSTTLATNACVEDRLGRAKLFFLGGDAITVDRYGAAYGMPPSEDVYLQESYSTYSGAFEQEFDWKRFTDAASRLTPGLDGAGVIELNAMRNGAILEKKAKEVLERVGAARVVCGHELSSELSCLQRGAGTLLNAGLFPIIDNFVKGVAAALERRDIAAPVVIVRSDGSMMGREFATLRPVETLLCGPAASVIGAMELSGRDDCVVVDIGGTTTDIAVVNAGVPVRSPEGIAIGKWRTFVKGVYIHTIGLGGDSALHYRDDELVLENYRVVPLCVAASAHPSVIEQLRTELAGVERHTRFLHEFFLLHHDISDNRRYTDQERRFCEALAGGPLILRRAAEAVGRDEYTLDMSRLLREGIVQVCGLTPTDVMHLRGDFAKFNVEASRLGAAFVAANLETTVEDVCERAYRAIRRKLYLNIVEALLKTRDREYRDGVPEAIRELILKSFDAYVANGPEVLSTRFRTSNALIGIGAPTHLFIADVAEMLGTTAIVPDHANVANAVGAIVGKVHVDYEALVRPTNLEGVPSFVVHSGDERSVFTDRKAAEKHAHEEAIRKAREEALRRGAAGDITVTCEEQSHTGRTREGDVYLGTNVVARAVGSPRF